MSRSQRAWAKGCELVGAAVSRARRLSGREVVRDHLAARRLVRSAPSLSALTWVATAVVLTLAFDPALASAKSINRSGRAPEARGAQDASRLPVAQIKQTSDASHSGGSVARRARTRTELIAFGDGYGGAHGSLAVRSLQRRLAGLGYAPGPIDGRYGPLTEQAVRRFQAAHGLIVDGVDGPVTRAALGKAHLVLRPGDGYLPGGSRAVRILQRDLAAAGFRPGPIDGRYGPSTTRAVRHFQAAGHLHVDGVAGPQTLGHLPRAHRSRVQRRSSAPAPRTRAHRRPASPSTRTPARTTAPASRHPGGGSPASWLIVLACLLVATLAGLLWHARRTRSARIPPPDAATATDEDTVLPQDTAQHEVAPDRVAPEPGPREPAPEDPQAGGGVFRLAQVLARAGNLVPAVDALRRADRLGHPGAAFELGVLLAQEGDLGGATDALLRAHDRGDPNAAFELGEFLERRGQQAKAQQAYRLGDQRGHAGAAFNLGVLLLRDHDLAGAEAAFRRADERGHAGASANLGVLLEERGELAGARAAYERADQRGEAVGAFNLGLLLEQEGSFERAKRAYRRAEERGEPAGAYKLGLLLKQEGDSEGALRALQRAGQDGPREVAEFAHAAMRELRTEHEEPDR